MLLYTHLVWSFDLSGFFGQNGWLPLQLMHDVHVDATIQTARPERRHRADTGRTSTTSTRPTLLWTVHIAALVVFFLLMIGLFSRTMAVLGVPVRRVVCQSRHARRLLRPRQNQLHARACT